MAAAPKAPDAPKEAEFVWPVYKTGPNKHLHALGVISVNYNLFEFALSDVLKHYAGEDVSKFFFERINNEERIEAIRHFVKAKERDAAILTLMDNLTTYFSACSNNRNILMHSRYLDGSESNVLSLEKNLRGQVSLLYFRLLLPDLRRFADKVRNGIVFVADLLEYLRARDAGVVPLPALPKKLRSPRTLNPSRHPSARADEPSLPAPSGGLA
jgi:hypothetical protein